MPKPRKRKTRKKATSGVGTPRDNFTRPTPELEARHPTRSAGAAKQIIPVIETLRTRKQITEGQYYALKHYREKALKAQDDARQSSALDPKRIMGGNVGGGFSSRIPAGIAATPAQHEHARLSQALGNLAPLVEAITVDEVSLSRWCIEKYGGREKIIKGAVVIVPACGQGKIDAEADSLRRAALKISYCMALDF